MTWPWSVRLPIPFHHLTCKKKKESSRETKENEEDISEKSKGGTPRRAYALCVSSALLYARRQRESASGARERDGGKSPMIRANLTHSAFFQNVSRVC